jgi:hypothetical protein
MNDFSLRTGAWASAIMISLTIWAAIVGGLALI